MCIVSVVSDWLTRGKEAQIGSSKRDRMYISVIRARCDRGSLRTITTDPQGNSAEHISGMI